MEDRIVECLAALKEEVAGEAEPMFVFPLSLMASPWHALDDLGASRCGDVARVSRRGGGEGNVEIIYDSPHSAPEARILDGYDEDVRAGAFGGEPVAVLRVPGDAAQILGADGAVLADVGRVATADRDEP